MSLDQSLLEKTLVEWGEKNRYEVRPRTYREDLLMEEDAFAQAGIYNLLERIDFVTLMPPSIPTRKETSFPHFLRIVPTPTGFISYSCFISPEEETFITKKKKIDAALKSYLKENAHPFFEFIRFIHGKPLDDERMRKIFQDIRPTFYNEIFFLPSENDYFTSEDIYLKLDPRLMENEEATLQVIGNLFFPTEQSKKDREDFFPIGDTKIVRKLRERILSKRNKLGRSTDPLFINRNFNQGDWLIRNYEGYSALFDVFNQIIQKTLPPHKRRR